MNRKYLVIIITLIILGVTTMTIVLLLKKSGQNTQQTPDLQGNDFPENINVDTDLILPNQNNNSIDVVNGELGFVVVGDKLSIGNTSGQEIMVRDFRSDDQIVRNQSFTESYSINTADELFSIFFYGASSVFQITLLDSNLDKTLEQVQSFLVDYLQINMAETCYLKTNIGAPGWITNDTKNLKFRNC